ncbi:MAG: type II toxin-antitoxin system VapC family toxin [Gaiellaceae bacterium]
MGVYVDTSALARVLLAEPDSQAVLDGLADFDRRVSSRLLGLELRRVALGEDLEKEADALLADVALVPIDDAILESAETALPANIATLDAIHLVTALRLAQGGDVDAFMTYDAQLAAGAAHYGIQVIAPTG